MKAKSEKEDGEMMCEEGGGVKTKRKRKRDGKIWKSKT